MNPNQICEQLGHGIGRLFTCSSVADYVRIRTPFLYPDGDYIDLYCKADDGSVVVTDLAETTGWLRMESVKDERTLKQQQVIDATCTTLGVQFHRGMLQARCPQGGELPEVVTRVAQAASRVSDLWFTLSRTQASQPMAQKFQPITDDVARFLLAREVSFRRKERLSGRTGRDWTIDFVVANGTGMSLINVLSIASRRAARRKSEHVFTGWHDLRQSASGREGLSFISLFDDTRDVWTEADFELVGEHSTVARWSRPDELVAALS